MSRAIDRRRGRRGPTQLGPPPLLAGVDQKAVDAQAKILNARRLALSKQMLSRGPSETVDVTGQTRNPVAAVPIVPVTVVSFTVPRGQIGVFNQLGITYSEPMIPMSQSVGWRLTMQGGQIPNVVQTAVGLEYFWWSAGEVNNPAEIADLWIQQTETLELQVYATMLFGEQLTITARLSGRLYSPGAPGVMS